MNCFNEKNEHIGSLIEIARFDGDDPISESVVRWCPQCGAVVVDIECDGRIYPGRVRKMQFPRAGSEKAD